MRKFIYLLFLASITAMAVGCSDNIIEENRVLKLDEAEVTFTDAKQSKLIKVTTDENNSFIVAWVGDNWGEAKVEEGNVIINVDANEGKEDRVSTVNVTLVKGGKTEKIEVKQQGEESSLGALPDDLFFNQLAGRKEITIFTNQSDWKAAFPVEEWASVIVDREKGVITVDILENDLEEDRTFTITLSSASAGLTKDIKVTQSAILTYILPFLKYGAPGPEVIAFEEARGSTYQSGRNPYMFSTLSKVMNRINYYTDRESYYLEEIEASFNKSLFDKEVYATLLDKNEYEFAFVEPTMWGDADIFWKESDKSYAGIFVKGYVKFSMLEEKPNNPVQSTAIPTFDSYPYGFHTIQSSFDDVKAWEAANGGVLYEDFSNPSSITFFTESDPVIAARIYLMDGYLGLSGVTRITTIVRDISKAMYPCIYTYIITNEFQALLAADGWVIRPYSTPGTNYYYENVDKNLSLHFYSEIYDDLPGLENIPILCLRLNPLAVLPSGLPSVLSGTKASDSKPMPIAGKRKAVSLRDLAQ